MKSDMEMNILKALQALSKEEVNELLQKYYHPSKRKMKSETIKVKHVYHCNFCGNYSYATHDVEFKGKTITPINEVEIKINWCESCKEVMKEWEQEKIVENAIRMIRKIEKTYFGV